jgi:hypothetical protein
MPITPDRRPGPLDEEGILLETTQVAAQAGEVRYFGGEFSFYDGVGEFKPLGDLRHRVLRQLIHFINDGPAEGFPSGSYRETTPTGPFPTSEIWWESSSKLKKIVSLDTTWSGASITQEVWKVYDTDGSSVLATITDAISYSGAFESSRTRTIEVS